MQRGVSIFARSWKLRAQGFRVQGYGLLVDGCGVSRWAWGCKVSGRSEFGARIAGLL